MPAGEAAEQVANMTIKGVEVAANVAGRAALQLATFLITAIKNREKTSGKTSIKAFDGKPTKVFVIEGKDFKSFAAEAKQYGVRYAAVVDKKNKNGLVDVIVNAKDAARVNRIAERFALSAVEVEKIQKEQLENEAQNTTVNISKETAEETFNTPEDGKNPTKARTTNRNPFARISENKKFTDAVIERKSVRKQIKEIRQKRELKKPILTNQKRFTVHKQPQKKKKVKSR